MAQYTVDEIISGKRLVSKIYRVMSEGGTCMAVYYNRHSAKIHANGLCKATSGMSEQDMLGWQAANDCRFLSSALE